MPHVKCQVVMQYIYRIVQDTLCTCSCSDHHTCHKEKNQPAFHLYILSVGK